MPQARSSDSAEIGRLLSADRLGTYLAAADHDADRALDLYQWNARASAALMLPIHLAEVSTRNAVDEALTRVYGPGWPWSNGFVRSLPAPRGRAYNPRRDLARAAAGEQSTGKVVAELRFAFWQSMFTARHDQHLWQRHLPELFPCSRAGASTASVRATIHRDLGTVRQVRNRIAHHEPVFTRDLAADLAVMTGLVALRSRAAGRWLRRIEGVTELIAGKPVGDAPTAAGARIEAEGA